MRADWVLVRGVICIEVAVDRRKGWRKVEDLRLTSHTCLCNQVMNHPFFIPLQRHLG